MSCRPDWAINGSACPYGSTFLFVTIPNEENAFGGSFGIYINVMYSLMAFMLSLVVVGSLVHNMLGAPWPRKSYTRIERNRILVRDLKFVVFIIICIVLNFIQKWLFAAGTRPQGSCQTDCGMPSGEALWSSGLFMIILIDITFAWALPHLTNSETGTPMYTEEEAEYLGYFTISTRGFFKRFFALMGFLSPVPASRVLLRDSSFAQVSVGVLEGGVLAIICHVSFVTLMRSSLGVSPAQKWGFAKRLYAWLDRSTGSRDGADLESPLREAPEAPEETRDSTCHIPILEKTPGLEFLTIRTDTLVNSLKEKRIEADKKIKEEEEKFKARIKEEEDKFAALQGELRRKKEEVEEQIRRVEKENKEQLQTLESSWKLESQKALDAQKLRADKELKEAVELEAESSKNRLAEQKEQADLEHKRKMQELRNEAEEKNKIAQQEHDRKLKEVAKNFEIEVSRQKDSNQWLIRTSAALDELTRYTEEGEWLKLQEKYEEIKDLRDKRAGDACTDEFRQIANSLTPLFEDKLRKAEAFLERWPTLVLAVNNALKEAETTETSLMQIKAKAKRLFDAVVALIKNNLSIEKAETAIRNDLVPECQDVELGQKISRWFCTKWQPAVAKGQTEEFSGKIKELQQKIINDALRASELGDFNFTDLETCCEAVDVAKTSFLEKAETLLSKRRVYEYKGILSQLGTMIYFLEHLELEDIEKTADLFAAEETAKDSNPLVKAWVKEVVKKEYNAGTALLQADDLKDIASKDVKKVIESMKQETRAKQCDCLGDFYGIFIALAEAWAEEFGLLAVPHHVQVVALLVFKKLVEHSSKQSRAEDSVNSVALSSASSSSVKTLIAQVSTGEGKSMLLAQLASFLAKQGKKVHVMSSDPKLVARDFSLFKRMFEKCGLDMTKVRLCIGDDKIPDDAIIAYCEAAKVMSFYTQKARCGKLGQDVYKDRILVIDEVDALVVDEAPSQEFVYDIGWRNIEGTSTTISEYVTGLLKELFTKKGGRYEESALKFRPDSVEKKQFFDEAAGLLKSVYAWKKKPKHQQDEDFRIYDGDYDEDGVNIKGKYVRMIKGKPNLLVRSNRLEVLRLLEDANYNISWYQHLFVMSKPRVFRQYEHIIGLSGTVGNHEEKKYFEQSFGANFFAVPPFLKTCKDEAQPDKEFYQTAEWAKSETKQKAGGKHDIIMYSGILGNDTTGGGPCVVVSDRNTQYDCVKSLALQAHKHVPVVIIARDSDQCDEYVRKLRQEAFKGYVPDDLIGALSNNDYNKDPDAYKAALKSSTQALAGQDEKEFRITVTDPTGARGTDYKMSDEDPDQMGGLMLIILQIPLSEREWVQYKGRTARQKWRGQYCAVLDAQSYKELEAKMKDERPLSYKKGETDELYIMRNDVYEKAMEGMYVAKDPDKIVEQILNFGEAGSLANLDRIKASYNAGWIANEVCEEVWVRWADVQTRSEGLKIRADVLLRGAERSSYVDLCTSYKYNTAEELETLIKRIKHPSGAAGGGLEFKLENSKAPDTNYVPEERPKPAVRNRRAVQFLMDCSGSMTNDINKGTGRPKRTRLEECEQHMQELLTSEDFLREGDLLGVAAFGKGYKELVKLGLRQPGQVESLIKDGEFVKAMDRNNLKGGLHAGTQLWLTTEQYIKEMQSRKWVPADATDAEIDRIIIALCDGADDMTGLIENKGLKGLNEDITIIVITVGDDENMHKNKAYIKAIVSKGSEKSTVISAADDPEKIREAFAQVQQGLAPDTAISGG